MNRLVLVLVLASCAKTAQQLSPFPCADDLTCPAGLACVGGQCAAATMDSICTTGSDPTDCSVAAPGAICSATSTDEVETGTCALPCSGGCPSGRACSDGGSSGGVCLVDCNGSSIVCPPNTYCLPRADGHKVCMPPGIGCRTVENVRRCTDQLCQSRWADVTCPNQSSTCPAESVCSSDSTRCTCAPGHEAFDCNDQACNGQCGGSNEWWCAPAVSAVNCFSDLDGVEATCQCWSGPVDVSCDRAGTTCDEICRDQ